MSGDLFSLSGQVAVVTGGGHGLGEIMVRALAEAGADVAICGRKAYVAEETAGRIASATGRRVRAYKCDVGDPKVVQAFAEEVQADFGEVDILVNNAGVTWGSSLTEHPPERWQQVGRVNVDGVFHCCKAFSPSLLAKPGRKVINISSVAGTHGAGFMKAPAYSASKGAVISLTKALAAEWAPHGVTVNALALGFYQSHMTDLLFRIPGMKQGVQDRVPLGRVGTDADLAGVIVFMAAAASDFMTGSVVTVDGGFSIS